MILRVLDHPLTQRVVTVALIIGALLLALVCAAFAPFVAFVSMRKTKRRVTVRR